MIQWNEERQILQPIEKVWQLFSDEHIQQIMPKVEEHILIEGSEQAAGAKHRQTYREGKRKETYIVETLQYEDRMDYKKKEIRFVLGKAFEVRLSFTLQKISENETKFIYEGSNKGVNFVGRAMMKMSSPKSNMDVVQEFLDRVESEANKEQGS